MKPDKVFILLLVVLLPLTGCIDATGNADAQDSTSSPNQNEEAVSTTMPAVVSLKLSEGNTHTEVFNGTTLKVETIHWEFTDPECSSNCPVTWYAGNSVVYSMTCSDGLTIESGNVGAGNYLPVLGGQECTVEFMPTIYNGEDRVTVVIFSIASLSAL